VRGLERAVRAGRELRRAARRRASIGRSASAIDHGWFTGAMPTIANWLPPTPASTPTIYAALRE
jgi:hypothetical protein